jgi:hypothetical protein
MMWDRMNIVIHEEELRVWILGPVYTMDQDSSQGVVRAFIGCWTRPGTTSVSTKEKMAE